MTFQLLLYFLVLLNPFSQIIVLWELMKSLTWREFASIYWRASLLSYFVFVLFTVAGDFFFQDVFQVRLDSFRIFGGLILSWIAFRYIQQGAGSNLFVRGNISDLAQQISLPFIVGPATLWLSTTIGQQIAFPYDVAGIGGVMLLNYAGVVTTHRVIHRLEGYRETMVGKYCSILMRINALFIGAIGVEMILLGIDGALNGEPIAG